MNNYFTRYKIVYLIVALAYFALVLWDPLKYGVKINLYFVMVIVLVNIFPRKYDTVKSVFLVLLLLAAFFLYFNNMLIDPFFKTGEIQKYF